MFSEIEKSMANLDNQCAFCKKNSRYSTIVRFELEFFSDFIKAGISLSCPRCERRWALSIDILKEKLNIATLIEATEDIVANLNIVKAELLKDDKKLRKNRL